jgi:hypothetical protein
MQVDLNEWSGRPVVDDAQEIVDNVAAEIDGVCQAAGYTVPVSDTAAVAMLKHYNQLGAAVAIWHAGWVSEDAPARVDYWERTYTAFLTRIRKGEQQLPGLSPQSDIDAAFAIAQTPPRSWYITDNGV